MVAALPAEFSITEIATLLRIPRANVKRRVASKKIPSYKMGAGRTSKRLISMAALRKDFRELYDAIVLKAQELGLDLPDDDEN